MAKVNDILQNVRIMAGTPYALAFPVADAAGSLTSDGSGALSFASASSSKIELVHESSGENSTISDNNFATYDLGGVLSMNTYFLILWQLCPQSSITNDPRLYLTNTSTQCGVLTERNAAEAWTSWSVGGQAVSGVFLSMTSWTSATVKQIAIRGYPQTGGTCKWSWNIYKVSPLVLL